MDFYTNAEAVVVLRDQSLSFYENESDHLKATLQTAVRVRGPEHLLDEFPKSDELLINEKLMIASFNSGIGNPAIRNFSLNFPAICTFGGS